MHGGKEVVDALCTHPDIKAISFVGSTAVGTHVYNLGSQHGKRVQSMMGAKNHAVVLPDANKEQTLNALVGAGFGAAGQRCMATSVVVLVGRRRSGCRTSSSEGEDAQGQRAAPSRTRTSARSSRARRRSAFSG